MTAVVLAGPSALGGLCLILIATPWLERLTGIPALRYTVHPDLVEHLEGPAAARIIGAAETSPSCTSV